MPLWPFSGSTVAKTTKSPASLELEIQALLPLITQSSPSRTALALSANASEPLDCSERAKLQTVSVPPASLELEIQALLP